MAYTKTVWVEQSTPGISATNLNHIEQGIYDNDAALATRVKTDGTSTITVTLGGSNKSFLTLTATDGHSYGIGQDTAHALFIWDATSAKNVLYLTATEARHDDINLAKIWNGQRIYIQSSAPTGVPVNTLWVDTSVDLG